MAIFNEESLRAAIVEKWGPAGAHVDVFDMVLYAAETARLIEECVPCGLGFGSYIDRSGEAFWLAWIDATSSGKRGKTLGEAVRAAAAKIGGE